MILDHLDRLGNGLTSPHLDFDTRSIGDDLLGGFFLSAWQGMPSLGLLHPQNLSLEVVPLEGGRSLFPVCTGVNPKRAAEKPRPH